MEKVMNHSKSQARIVTAEEGGGVVATYAYINPLIAVILGNLILKERLSWITSSAFILTITGVYLVNKGYNSRKS